MRIAIDASRTTVHRMTGTEHYARRLIQSMLALATDHEFTLYFRDTPPPDLFPQSDRVRHRVIPWRRAWTHLRFAAAIAQDRPDITFVPAHTLPFVFPGTAAVTVHDLGYRYFPQAHTRRDRLYLELTTAYSARRAAVVLADSQATAQDLNAIYGTPPAKIQVVYPGVTPPPIGDIETVRARYHLPARYFLFLGTLQPRKNIACIVQSYMRWRQANPDDPAELVLAGGKGWLYNDSWSAGMPGVHMPGFIDDRDKGALYAGALALVFPSLYEGFGFPVLEAMHCGLPVIASNTSSLPELAGDAALLVDPLDTGAIANKMTRIATNADLRDMLRQKGYARVTRFTWEQAARKALAALEQATPQ